MATKLGKMAADFTTQLATKIVAAGTTGTLQSITDDDGIDLPAGQYYFTVDGSNSQKEHFQCQLSSTAMTAIKSVSRQGVLTAGAAREHRVGAVIVMTDFFHIMALNNLLAGTDAFDSATKLGYGASPSINSGDVYKFATVEYVNGVAIAGAPDATTTVKGIVVMSYAPASPTSPIAVGDNDPRVPTQNENDALVGTSGTATSSSNKLVDNADTLGTGKIRRSPAIFGGTGADGALTTASGTTTIDLGGAAYFVKNYTSISITGTANIAFSNPHANGTIIVFKSQGNVTITSSSSSVIDVSSLGANGGTIGNSFIVDSYFGSTGTSGVSAAGAAGGVTNRNNVSLIYGGAVKVFCGAGGGTGGTAATAGGAGGKGGGGLYIECGGAYNFTSGIMKANGAVGTAGTDGASGAGGGGGGGAAGSIVVIYGTLTADSGTYTLTGGAGGQGGASSTNTVSSGSGGGGGGAYLAGGAGGNSGPSSTGANTNAAGGAGGTVGVVGSAGSTGGASCGGGGGGGAGGSKISLANTFF